VKHKVMKYLWIFSAILATPLAHSEANTRLKELASVQGVRDNQLIGYGLVVGLNGTGDRQQTVFSTQSLSNLLQQMGVSVPATAIRVKNTAGVMVTGTLPAFSQPGSRVDVNVAAMGDAANLQGGLLVLTSLRGIDGQVYAIAQGPVVTGGFAAGRSGNSQTVNHPTAGRVPNGAIIERAGPAIAPVGHLNLQLHHPDFTTASRISEVVNRKFGKDGPAIAKAENSGTVAIKIPVEFSSHETDFVAELEHLQVEPDRIARVIVNERTGTIVMGKEVRVSPVAIMHGNLTVEIQTTFNVSQPAPLSQGGKTEVVPQVSVNAAEEKSRNVVLKQGATVEELVHALGAIGSSPRDVIAILQSLRAAGALEAELEII
jgi:flagellar P-ring protein precursor FlgI